MSVQIHMNLHRARRINDDRPTRIRIEIHVDHASILRCLYHDGLIDVALNLLKNGEIDIAAIVFLQMVRSFYGILIKILMVLIIVIDIMLFFRIRAENLFAKFIIREIFKILCPMPVAMLRIFSTLCALCCRIVNRPIPLPSFIYR